MSPLCVCNKTGGQYYYHVSSATTLQCITTVSLMFQINVLYLYIYIYIYLSLTFFFHTQIDFDEAQRTKRTSDPA